MLLVIPEEMDQEYERRLLRQINHQNLPAEARLTKVRHRERNLTRFRTAAESSRVSVLFFISTDL